ncbi:hypothetical protein [Bifidobacterium sp.]|uniref:hypothetical protein n=1 Tax=Bifidobacterium sp. TaxID=41200 RepID=UPI0025BCDF32|nr:hypothetical protein [Bifidobacterium sp.]MCI1634611.1 hypothetical protein [Bifidobacterium sp.]
MRLNHAVYWSAVFVASRIVISDTCGPSAACDVLRHPVLQDFNAVGHADDIEQITRPEDQGATIETH